MSPPNPARQSSPSPSRGKGGSSAQDHETRHSGEITESKDRDRDDDMADLVKKEAAKRVQQDDAIATMTRQAKEAGEG